MQVSSFVPMTTETTELDVFVNVSHFLHTVRVKKKKENQEAKKRLLIVSFYLYIADISIVIVFPFFGIVLLC